MPFYKDGYLSIEPPLVQTACPLNGPCCVVSVTIMLLCAFVCTATLMSMSITFFFSCVYVDVCLGKDCVCEDCRKEEHSSDYCILVCVFADWVSTAASINLMYVNTQSIAYGEVVLSPPTPISLGPPHVDHCWQR